MLSIRLAANLDKELCVSTSCTPHGNTDVGSMSHRRFMVVNPFENATYCKHVGSVGWGMQYKRRRHKFGDLKFLRRQFGVVVGPTWRVRGRMSKKEEKMETTVSCRV